MEGLANRVQPHMLQAQQNSAGTPHYGGITIQQTQAEKMPPTYEEAQLAVQAVDMQQITNMEAEKQAIYRHPLLPLLARLFEKCEQSTQTCEATPANSFDNEIKNGILQMNREGKPFYTDDRELDNLMVKAIQVLRIHLLELEKVNELCKDFCQRYIACLKGKMQSENLLRSPLQTTYSPAVNVMNTNVQPQTPTTPIQAQQTAFVPQPQQQITYYATPVVTPCTVANVTPAASVIGPPLQQQVATVTYVPQGVAPGQQIVIAQVPQSVPQQPVVQTTVAYSSIPSTVTYTSVSPNVTYVNAPTIETITPARPQTASSGDESPTEITVPSSVPLPALDSPTEVTDKKRTRRGVLPKQATNIMKTWLFQHLVHPYPTEDEKRAIAAQTNLTILQVNNWFINARRRILQPMLDASNPEGPKAKKSKIQSRPAQRFWPENLVPSQFNTIPIAPAPVTVQAVMQGAVQMQQVPPGTAVAVAPGTALPTTITIPNVQGTTVIPGTVTLQQQQQQQTGTPSTVVVVSLPPSGSHINTVTAAESSSVDTTRQTIIAPVVSSHVESVAVSSLSPMYSNIQQGSPSLQNSPLPTMVQNGSMGGREGNLVGSPHHIPVSSVSMSGVQDNLVGVTAISLENAAVSRSRVN
ncbi:homeobox protein PKNOX1-like [Acropora muricata]|uniref:homeobox protein PKNOX1-like n=1 Tax=Acropora muricata TaxID=159855 RepID=UPI0034E3DED8